MSVREVLKQDPLAVALAVVRDGEDKARREKARQRVDFYQDRIRPHLESEVRHTFKKPEVRARLDPFLGAASGVNIFKRIVDEIARPVYAMPPRRKVSPSDAAAYAALRREARFDEKMDLSCRLTQATNLVWQHYRVSERLGVTIHLYTPDQVRVIPDPEDPLRALGIVYDIKLGNEKWYVFWDDAETLTFNGNARVLPGSNFRHGYPRMPWVPIHRKERCSSFHDIYSGDDLVHTQLAVSLLIALIMKLHKSQGFKQLVASGDAFNTVTSGDQTLDEESMVIVPDGTTIQLLDLKSDAGHYLQTMQSLIDMTAANYGINRDRMNQKTTSTVEEAGLLERRQDAVKAFRRAEFEAFEVMKMVSRQHPNPEMRMSEDAKLEQLDFAEISDRADKLTLLQIWQQEQAMALRTPIQNIMALNPEIETEEEAAAHLAANIDVISEWITRLRELNMSKDTSFNGGGQTPEENGRMGPAVRDGAMTRDEAADLVQ